MLRRRFACCLALLIASTAVVPARAAGEFPFGSELVLDAPPMPGSKRIPMIQIEDNGSTAIDLWCVSVKAQATVGDVALSIVPTAGVPAPCTADRQAADASLLDALAQVTGWRRSGELIEFTGPTTLRFRLMTN